MQLARAASKWYLVEEKGEVATLGTGGPTLLLKTVTVTNLCLCHSGQFMKVSGKPGVGREYQFDLTENVISHLFPPHPPLSLSLSLSLQGDA